MSYSISQQMINKSAIIFYQKNMSKQTLLQDANLNHLLMYIDQLE